MIRRWVLNFAAAASLALCMATVVLWVQSYWIERNLEWITGYYQAYAAYSQAGAIYVPLWDKGSKWDHWDLSLSADKYSESDSWQDLVGPHSRLAGVRLLKTGGELVLMISFWFPAAIALGCAAIFWIKSRHCRITERLRIGNCPACGYNLTANASGVCPECGTAVLGKQGSETKT